MDTILSHFIYTCIYFQNENSAAEVFPNILVNQTETRIVVESSFQCYHVEYILFCKHLILHFYVMKLVTSNVRLHQHLPLNKQGMVDTCIITLWRQFLNSLWHGHRQLLNWKILMADKLDNMGAHRSELTLAKKDWRDCKCYWCRRKEKAARPRHCLCQRI